MPVCILGMHRSGTSMVTRLLHECGMYVGEPDDLLPPHSDDNPEGYWENRTLVSLNDEILSKFNAHWYNPPDLQPGWSEAPEFRLMAYRFQAVINDFKQHPYWGWKDPRNSFTLELWQRYIPDLKLIICVRNPYEVVQSMMRRYQAGHANPKHFDAYGGLSTQVLYTLWNKYYENILKVAALENTLVTHYNAYFYNAEAELRRLLTYVGMEADDQTIKKAASTIDTELKHQMMPDSVGDVFAPTTTYQYYKYICSFGGEIYQQMQGDVDFQLQVMRRFTKKREADYDQKLAAQKTEFEKQKRIFEHQIEAQKRTFETDLEASKTELQIARQQLQVLEAEQTTLQKRLKDTEQQIRSQESVLQYQSGRLKAQEDALKRLDETIMEQRTQLDTQKTTLESQNTQIAEHNSLLQRREAAMMQRAFEMDRTRHSASVYALQAAQLRNIYRSRPIRFILRLRRGFRWSRLRLAQQTKRLQPPPVFDAAWYSAQFPQDKRAASEPYLHYLMWGWQQGVRPNPLFDPEWYLSQISEEEIMSLGRGPLLHYLNYGWQREYDPCFYFSVQWYLRTNDDVQSAKIEPLTHYLLHGWQENRSPSPFFDTGWYLRNNADVRSAGVEPLSHYILNGWRERRSPSPHFDTRWYLEQYPEVAQKGIEPLYYYLNYGWRLGHQPNKHFDPDWYLKTHVDVRKAGIEPLTHYLNYGLREGRTANSRDSGLTKTKPPETAAATAPDTEWANKIIKGYEKTFSVIMPTWNRAAVITEAIDSCLAQTYSHFELIICDDGSTDGTGDLIRQKYAAEIQSGKITYLYREHRGVSAARNTALKRSTGDWIAYLDSDNIWYPDYLLMMAATFVAYPERNTAYAFVAVNNIAENQRYIRRKRFNYDLLVAGNYIDLNIYAHRRGVMNELGIFDESLKRLVDWDLILRHLRVYEPEVVPYVLCEYRVSKRLNNISLRENLEANRKRVLTKINRQLPNIAIKIPAPPLPKGLAWGDYHLALGLQRGLATKGYRARIDFLYDWYSEGMENDDIVFVIRGLTEYKPSPGKINILWNISHPDKVTLEEYNRYDLVLVASERYAKELREKCSVPVEVMHQFTDHDLFYPDPGAHPARDEVLFVGNSRKVYRTIVRDSVEQEIDISVYGSLWEELIPNKYIKGQLIPNQELHQYYASAAIVLNDHWDSMREYGFVSNRIYDVGASGGFVISDYLSELETDFAGQVVTYHTSQELKEKITYYRTHPEARAEVAARLRENVMKHYTVLPRVKQLDAIFSRLMGHKITLRIGLLYPNSPENPAPTASVRLLSRLRYPSERYDFEYTHFTTPLILNQATSLRKLIDILIIQRQQVPLERIDELLNYVSNEGVSIIYEIDDNLLDVPGHVDVKGQYKNLKDTLIKTIRAAELVTVSTPKLAETISEYNPNTVVVPNYFDDNLWITKPDIFNSRLTPPNGDIRILYMGSITHERDLALLDKVAQEIRRRYPSVTFHLIGGARNAPTWLNVVQIPPNTHLYEAFIKWFQQTARDFDFAIAPLEDNEFTASKSYIKYLDYSAAGLAGIYSHAGQYPEIVRNGENGLLVENTQAAWTEAITYMIENPERRLEMARCAYETVDKHHRLSRSMESYFDMVASLII